MTVLSPLLACLTVAGRLAGWARRVLDPGHCDCPPPAPLPTPLAQLSAEWDHYAQLVDPLYDHDERTRQP